MAEIRASAAAAAVEKKHRYHHGALRQALIEAAHRLISERGLEAFTIADACRLAGVSTAAPYRHFADRDALVAAVAARGFDRLAERTRAARDAHPVGSLDAIVAMGQAYVAFVTQEPALFQLMWGAPHGAEPNPETQASGQQCFGVLLEAIDAFRADRGLQDMATLAIAMPLWTIVHGTASLVLGGRFQKMAPDTSVDDHVDRATRAFLKGLLR